MRYAARVCAGILTVLAAGCTAREVRLEQLRTDNPRVQVAAIAETVRAGDRSMVPELINLLDAQDEGVRFMAALGLHQLTGQDFDRRLTKAEDRAAVIAKWRQWWDEQQKAK